MKKRPYTARYLSDHAGGKICVVCPKCGLRRQYDVDKMLQRIEDQPMPSILPKIARAEGCKKVDNAYSDRCHLHFDLAKQAEIRSS